MTEYKCGSAESCQFGDMCKPSYDIGGCSHYKEKRPQTNEEWLKNMNTERFAEALAWIEDRGELPTVRKENVKAFEKWLKEIHI